MQQLRRTLSGVAALLGACAFAVGCARGNASADARTTTDVKARLSQDEMVNAAHVDVATKDRVVTLRGAVPSDEARTRAVMAARQTPGVKNVIDELTVKSAEAAPRPTELPAAGNTGEKAGGSRHTVKRGETLGRIAKEEYGDSSRWRDIYDANRNVLSDPNHVPVGADLTIPAK